MTLRRLPTANSKALLTARLGCKAVKKIKWKGLTMSKSKRRVQRSKRARDTKKEAVAAGLPVNTGHPTHGCRAGWFRLQKAKNRDG